MRITGPTLRRRNHAWLQMRNLERRARLAQRQQQDDTTSDDADTSGDESDFASSADDSDSEPPRGLRVSVGLPRRAVRSVRIEGGAGNIAATASLTTKVDSTSDSETDVDSTDSADSSDSIETSDDSDNESPPPARPRVRATRAVHARLGGRAVNHIATLPTKRQEVPAESSDSASSVDSSDGESEDESPQPTRAPTSSVRIGAKVKNALPTARSEVSPGASLSAEDAEGVEVESESDGEESDDETTSSPANAPPTATSGPPPPPAVTAPAATSEVAGRPPPASSDGPDRNRPPPPPPPSMTSTPDTSSSTDDFLTSLTGVAPTQLSTLSLTSTSDGASPTVPATGNAQTGDSQDSAADSQANQREGDNLGITPMPQNKLSSGAVAGIVIGVLAFVALLAGALFFWWRRRRQQGLPFLPFVARNQPSSRSDDPNIAGPLPGEVGGPSHFKTNTEIMDDLMKAAYATDGGANDMEGAYGTAAEKFPPQQQTTAFMDEQAYAALAGPLAPPTPKKPVMEWLTEVRTPTQPNGPEIPPTPKMPPSVRMPMESGGRVPEAPRTAYNGRETMTTETTNTSVRWYG